MRYFGAVSILEAIVIYLSIGAPFGVLRLLSGPGERRSTTILLATVSVLVWPYSAIRQLIYSLNRRLTRFRGDPAQESSPELSLFAISGHPRPELAAICYRRARRKVVVGRSLAEIGGKPALRRLDRLDNDGALVDESRSILPVEHASDAGSATLRV